MQASLFIKLDCTYPIGQNCFDSCNLYYSSKQIVMWGDIVLSLLEFVFIFIVLSHLPICAVFFEWIFRIFKSGCTVYIYPCLICLYQRVLSGMWYLLDLHYATGCSSPFSWL
jgi:hypothetical protein